MRNEFLSCPACGAPLTAHNGANPSEELLEGWDFACHGGLYRNEDGKIAVNFECRGTTPLEDKMRSLTTGLE